MSEEIPVNGPRMGISVALTLSFYVVVVVMALIQVFGIFRGLSSPVGMDQAQIAREIARGNGFHTKMIRPYAWQQMIGSGRDEPLSKMQDAFQPPLQPLILAPVFKLLEKWSKYDPANGSAMYLLDRVVAGLGVTWFLLAIALTVLTLRELFDEQVALVTAVILVLCQPLWNLAVSGSPQILLVLWFAMAFYLFTKAILRVEEGLSPVLALLGVGFACGLMVLTHWLALALVLGLGVAAGFFVPRRILGVSLVMAIPALCLMGMGWRNYVVCGEVLGVAKASFQSMLVYGGDEPILRDFVSMNPGIAVDSILRKMGLNFQEQWLDAHRHLGAILPALLFFISLFHRFRRLEVNAACWALGMVWLATSVAMALVGLRSDAPDDNNLFCALIPMMTGFGVAMLAVMWARLDFEREWFWRQWGYGLAAIFVSALPMLSTLPAAIRTGIAFRGELAHWPPYLPDRFVRLNSMLAENEILFSDAPWALAWYADRTAVWMPIYRKQFPVMEAKAEANGEPVAGFVITPISAEVKRLTDIFGSSYREWADLIYRGPMVAFKQEIRSTSEFPYNAIYPLAAIPLESTGGLNVMMVYYADKVRWDAPKEVAGQQ